MKRLYTLLSGFCFLAVACMPAAAKDFIAGFEDIPLVKGFRQIENDNFSFGNEETRYIETELKANGRRSFAEVKKFYLDSLKQLGWHPLKDSDSELHFYRENDVLEINKISKSPLRIRIILKNRT